MMKYEPILPRVVITKVLKPCFQTMTVQWIRIQDREPEEYKIRRYNDPSFIFRFEKWMKGHGIHPVITSLITNKIWIGAFMLEQAPLVLRWLHEQEAEEVDELYGT